MSICPHLLTKKVEDDKDIKRWKQWRGRGWIHRQTQMTFRWIILSLHTHVSLCLSSGGEKQSLWPPPTLTLILLARPLHSSLQVSVCHPLLNPPTTSTCYVPPEGIIFTLTTSINLSQSCTRARTKACTQTHTHGGLRSYTHIFPPLSIPGVKVTGHRSSAELLHRRMREWEATTNAHVYTDLKHIRDTVINPLK